MIIADQRVWAAAGGCRVVDCGDNTRAARVPTYFMPPCISLDLYTALGFSATPARRVSQLPSVCEFSSGVEMCPWIRGGGERLECGSCVFN